MMFHTSAGGRCQFSVRGEEEMAYERRGGGGVTRDRV